METLLKAASYWATGPAVRYLEWVDKYSYTRILSTASFNRRQNPEHHACLGHDNVEQAGRLLALFLYSASI